MTERTVLDYSANDPDMVRDSCPFLKRARAETPVFWSDRDGGFWTIARWQDVWDAAHDPARFTSAVPGATVPVQTFARTEGFIPLEYDDPIHAEYRAVTAPLFSVEHVARLEPEVVRFADEALDALAPRCDLVADYALPLVSRALVALLHLNEAERPALVTVMDGVLHARGSDTERAAAASRDLRQFVVRMIDDRRQDPRGDDDFFSRLHAGQVEGRPLTQAEMELYGVDILLAGFESTVNGIGSALHHLASDPRARAELSAQPRLVRGAVEEYLRVFAPVQIFGRHATRDLEFCGQLIREKEMVVLHFASANRDEDVFEDPDTVRFDRRPNRHLAFGAGPHVCLGAHVARMEMRVAITRLLHRFPDITMLDGPDDAPRHTAHGDLKGIAYLPVVLKP